MIKIKPTGYQGRHPGCHADEDLVGGRYPCNKIAFDNRNKDNYGNNENVEIDRLHTELIDVAARNARGRRGSSIAKRVAQI